MSSITKTIIKNSRKIKYDKGSKNNSAILSALAFFIVMSTISAAMIYVSYYVTKQLNKIHQPYAFINILLIFNFLILFGKSIFETLNVLYFSNDLKVLLRMPIKPIKILNAKFINMIVSEYQMEAIMLAIPMVVYGIYTKVAWMFYLYIPLVLLILPVIPIMITSLFIAIVMRLTSFVKSKNKLIYLIVFTTIFIMNLVFFYNKNGQTFLTVDIFVRMIYSFNGLAYYLAEEFKLITPIMNCLLDYNRLQGVYNLVIYYVENLLIYFIVLLIISKIYYKAVLGTMIDSSSKARKNSNEELSIEDFKEQNRITSYLNKEFLEVFRNPIFCIQCVFMPIIYPIIVLVIFIGLLSFAKAVGLDLIKIFYDNIRSGFGAFILLAIGQVFFMMNFSSIIAVSKEEAKAKLNKVYPISLEKQFKMKINVGFLVNMVAVIIICGFYLAFMRDLSGAALILINLIILNIIGEKVKLLIDLLNPQLMWNSEYTMMKQNTNIMYVLFYTGAVLGVLYIYSRIITMFIGYLIGITCISLLTNIIINERVRKLNKNNDLFRKVYLQQKILQRLKIIQKN